MRCRSSFVAAVVASSTAVGASAAEIAIAHVPAACVAPDRYARIAATGSPAERVAAAELQFRGEGGGDWYSVTMTRAGGGFEAHLPRPTRRTARVEYRVVMTGTDAATSATPAQALAVDPACGSPGVVVEVPAPIVVRVPAGAPPVPPVPAGFSPAGVVAAEEKRGMSTAAKWVTGASLAAVAAAAAAATAGAEPGVSQPGPLSFLFTGTTPNPGTALSIARDRLVVMLRVLGGPREPLTFVWELELQGADGQRCATMRGVGEVSLVRPNDVTVTAPIQPTGACGDTFDVPRMRLQVVFGDALAYDEVLQLPYRLQP